ncbi:hypothetical protein AB1Y20_019239 [Prymnesium parvum]|uniref:Uncharacterized protein n=1 Tax=Prymnesium parvum TaxID=97485 RepID=A0AB34JUJ0_PRYPA
MRAAFSGILSRWSDAEPTPPTAAPDEPLPTTAALLGSLEEEAAAASRALTAFSAALRARCDAAPHAVQPQHLSLPTHELQYLQLMDSRGQTPALSTPEQHHDAQRAARDLAAFDALRGTQQEIFAAARAEEGAQGVSEFLQLAVTERADEDPAGTRSAAAEMRAAVSAARGRLAADASRHERQARAALAAATAGPYALRAAVGAVRGALSSVRASIDGVEVLGELATATICESASRLPRESSSDAADFNPNQMLSHVGMLMRELEAGLASLCAQQTEGIASALRILPSHCSPSLTDLSSEEEVFDSIGVQEIKALGFLY